MTIRERIAAIQRTLRDTSPDPNTVRESLVTLTALFGNCTEEYRTRELAYKPVLLRYLRGGGAANRARIEAECSEEYAKLREAQDVMKTVQQMIVTCRTYLRSLDEEMRLQK